MGYCFSCWAKWVLYTLAMVMLWLAKPLFAEQKVYVAVASNFVTAFEQLKVNYASMHPDVEIVTSYGSSGKLFAQISHGAPYQIFLSADKVKPEKLVELSLANNPTIYTYAFGRLVLVAHNLQSEAKTQLTQQLFKHIAIANPKLAPYGLAAQNVLDNLGVNLNRQQIAVGENISQTYQFFTSKHTQLAFVAYSQIFEQSHLNVWLVPENLYQPIEQSMVLLKSAEHNNAAAKFYQFLQSQRAQCLIASLGYKSQVCSH